MEGEESFIRGFWWENHLEDSGVDGRIEYEDESSGNGMGGIDWIDLAQDRDM
jgi:hypothetical protein